MSENISEVSCRVLGILFQELSDKNLPLEALTDSVPYPLEHLQDPHAWIDWQSFCTFMRNAGKIWNDEELIKIGCKLSQSQFQGLKTTIARLFFTPKDLFQRVNRQDLDGRDRNFTCTHGLFHQLGPNLLEFDLTVRAGYELSPEFFLITKGTFIGLPLAMGLKEASVEMVPISGGTRFHIHLPSGGGKLAGMRRFFIWPFTMRSTARELKEANEQLQLRYRELEEQIQERKRAELLQDALYRIAGVANSAASFGELYPAIHGIIRELMPADNFFIALYDQESDILELPYFVDEVDTTYTGPYRAAKGLTERVIHTGEPLLINRQEHEQLIERGEVNLVGVPAAIWLGVPLISASQTFGAMVVQHYTDPDAYQELEKQVLSFVSGQVATVIDRKRGEEALRVTERRFRQLAENIEEVFFLTSADESTLYYINPAYETVTGLSCESLYANPHSWVEVLHPDDKQRVLNHWKNWKPDVVEEEKDTELRILHPDGSVKWVWLRSQPVYEGDDIVGRVGVVVDITERKALRQAQKQESLGILAGGVAHDFNNLLVAMLGQTSLALSKMTPQSPAWPHINKAVKAAERAADLTRQMLAYSGQGHFAVRLLNLNALIQENLHLFEAGIPKNIRIKTSFTTPLPTIEADPGQMQQVIMNLILNGAEAIGESPGLIEIITQIQSYRPDDSLFWQYTGVPMEAGQYVRLDVRDDGVGMDEATLVKIFDPFYTTKFTGRGLGLAVVLGIVRGHKGGLRVTSVPGLGAQFTLLFPIANNEKLESEVEEEKRVEEKRAGVVLVIDDEEPVREAVIDILEIEAIRVLTATNGLEGIEVFEQHHNDIDLVLLDLSMPGLGGAETFRRINEIDQTVPVLLSSGYTQTEVDNQFPEERPAGFLQKPYSANVLVVEVMRQLRAVRS
ncbi:MAG: response regulator [Candidatus Promineifilaceae bacterium]